MKRVIHYNFFLFLALCVCMLPTISAAQDPDLFDRQQEAPPTELEELLGEVPEEILPTPETPKTVEEFANQYYQNCLRQEHPKVEGESLEVLCACTAAKFPENMTLEQTLAMQRNTAEGKMQRIRFLEFIYLPCVRFPTSVIVEKRCLANKEIKKQYRNYKAICSCTGEEMGDYMHKKAPSYNSHSMYRTPTSTDPLIHLVDSKIFNQYHERSLRYCIGRYEYGKK